MELGSDLEVDPEITKIMPVDEWDPEMTQEEIDDLWLNYGERDIDPLYGIEGESRPPTTPISPLSRGPREERGEVAEKEFEDELMTTHYFKLPGEYLYLIGKDWPSYDVLQLETQS